MIKYIRILIVFLLLPLSLFSQSQDTIKSWIFYPESYKPYDFHISIGATLTKLPKEIVEEEIDQLPMLDIHWRFGLPWNFSIIGRLSTIYLTNQFSVGLKLSKQFDKLSLGASAEWGLWYGIMKSNGFDVSSRGFVNHPSFFIGYKFDELLFTTKTEVIIQSQKTWADKQMIGDIDNRFAGIGVSFLIEQPLVKNHNVLFGMKFNYTKFYYQSWLSFATFDEYVLYPELMLGYIL